VTLSDTLDQDGQSYPFGVLRIRRDTFKPWRFVRTVLRILQAGRQAQLLYVNGLYLETVVANFFLRKPLVQKIVGDWAWERATNKGWLAERFEEFQVNRHGLKTSMLKILRNFCVRRADTVIAPSGYLARWIGHWGVPAKKITVIYNAVEHADGVRAIDPPLATGVELRVVTVGRLVPWKQVDHLIEAVAACAGAGLVIVGDGPERGRLEELVCARGLTERVYFAGQKGKKETLSFMAACDLFVLNSTYEGFPHVVLEAMSVGLPVVATAVGGTPEVVCNGENGLLIAAKANGALSETLLKLASSSAERKRLADGAKRTTAQFQHSTMIEQTEALLRKHIVLQSADAQ
jgi:glycosyltransferase involved in cell wall biosynthesis